MESGKSAKEYSRIMCGIAGIINIRENEVQQARSLKSMTNRMVHRGPDDEGFLLIDKKGRCRSFLGDDTPVNDPACSSVPGYPQTHIKSAFGDLSQVALGHRRLSIIDLSPYGHQPMCTPDFRYWMVYNGEIYNFREITIELNGEGIKLFGNSDSEVLINAYAKWGERCLQKFNGMFAFAIWDNREKTLFCARDRIGIKPFYYTIQQGQFIFASDIKTIIASDLYRPEPDMEGLYLAMAFGMAPRPKTAFKGVVALDQAHWMRIHQDGRIEKEPYWSIPIGTQKHNMSEGEAIDLLEEQLTASVKRRLVADVPVGTFMSGGIDSTTISAIASELHPGIKAFTLAYENTSPELNEVPQAITTAHMHRMDHIVHCVDPIESLKDIESWIDGYEEPFYGLPPNYEISKLVKSNNVTVVLNGIGGDELFAGYGWYSHVNTWRIARIIKPLIDIIPPFAGRHGLRLKALSHTDTADRVHTTLFAQSNDDLLHELFTDPLVLDMNTPEILHDMYVGSLKFTDSVEAMSYMDLMNYIGNHHVHRSDQFTMAHSIEARFPFLDHTLVEAAFRIPTYLKKHGKIQKYVLRKVAEKYIAPECLSMKKKGFTLPLRQWMDGPLKPLVNEKLSMLGNRREIRRGVPTRWLREYEAGKRKFSLIWHLASLEMWFSAFIDKKTMPHIEYE
jgi:asparagine synthase (glutamine-hydrolysing)